MTTLTFLGAAGTVTGSRHLVTTSAGQRVLVDAGLFQGRRELRDRNWAPWTAGKLDAVVLTHAHIDHTGFLPRLVGTGAVGRIVCTEGTRDLCALLLPDSAHLQEEDARLANERGYSRHHPALPLYTSEQAQRTLELLEAFAYDEPVDVLPGVSLTFRRAGHIVGSAFVELRTDGKRIGFSGDLGRFSSPLLRPPEAPGPADALLLECTYGDRQHPPDPPDEALAEQIHAAIARGGPLIVPAFAVGRTQEILFLWRKLEHEGRIPEVPLFVDSPMATDATPIYLRYRADQSAAVRELLAQRIAPLHPARLAFVRGGADSQRLLERRGFFAVIAASGMATGGRVLAHLERHLPSPATTVLLVGYQAEETRGRKLLDGAAEIKMRGRMVPVRARVVALSGFSAHADYAEEERWLSALASPPARTFLVHGEAAALEAQRARLAAKGWNVTVPAPFDSVQL
jgi:metallo-beta-lactamase family protein